VPMLDLFMAVTSALSPWRTAERNSIKRPPKAYSVECYTHRASV